MKSFESFWNELQIELRKPRKIRNWTAKKGSTGDDFFAYVKNENYVICKIMAGNDQNVPKNDFQIIYDHWEDYLAERVTRAEFAHGCVGNSRFTKYTISIIHQFLK
jgi:hypothetical protein